MQDVRPDLDQQLRHLHSRGLAQVDVAELSEVMALSLVKRSLQESNDSDPRVGLANAIVAAANRLSPKDRDLITLLFGVERAYGWGVHKRHRAVAAESGLAWNVFRHSPFEGLRRRLLSVLTSDEVTFRRASSTGGVGYRLELLEHDYVVPTTNDPSIVVVERRRLIAESDGLEEWRVPIWYHLSSLAGEPSIRLIGAGQLTFEPVMLRGQEGTGFKADLSVRFPHPLSQGESFEFKLYRRIPVDLDVYRGAMGPFYTGFDLLPRAERLEIRVQFDPNNLPSRIERQDAVTPSQQFEFGALGTESVELDGRTEISCHWKSTQPRYWYGLIWE
jgi:hypothetical protein